MEHIIRQEIYKKVNKVIDLLDILKEVYGVELFFDNTTPNKYKIFDNLENEYYYQTYDSVIYALLMLIDTMSKLNMRKESDK